MSLPPQGPSATADQGLGADQELALMHVAERHKVAMRALFAIDAALADVVARATQPALGRIKLAWWRDELERLDGGAAAAEPRLRGAALHLLPRGISGAELSALEEGWATLLDEQPDAELVGMRGRALFAIGAKILSAADPLLGEAGALYTLAAAGRRGVPDLLDHACAASERVAGHRFSRAVRPLTGLARVAMRDIGRGGLIEAEGSPGRAAAMLRHRWSGIVAPRR